MFFSIVFCVAASAQPHKPTVTIINNVACDLAVDIIANGCAGTPGACHPASPITVTGGTTFGPADATSFTWKDMNSPYATVTPGPFTISYNHMTVGMITCGSPIMGSGPCGTPAYSPSYTYPMYPNFPNTTPTCACANSVATVSYAANGDLTITVN